MKKCITLVFCFSFFAAVPSFSDETETKKCFGAINRFRIEQRCSGVLFRISPINRTPLGSGIPGNAENGGVENYRQFRNITKDTGIC
ncbi:MAG: hypothetical protein LBF88_07575 [Planctomycetaceae bacterium]|jgi:hypothetical protein|nr:hypothetical protein [Planctomycetaceae bacterium]